MELRSDLERQAILPGEGTVQSTTQSNSQRGGDEAMRTGARDETGQLAGALERDGEDRSGTRQADSKRDRQSGELH